MGNLGTNIDLYLPYMPASPYFAIKLDGKIYDLSVNFLKEMSFEKAGDREGKWSFTMEDTMDLSLEAKLWTLLQNGDKNVCFQYGWYNGLRSEWNVGRLNDYLPAFHSNTSMTLTLEGVIAPRDLEDQIMAFKGRNPVDIVQQICDNEGWPLVEVDKADNFDEEMEFIQGNEPSFEFIRNKIEPECSSNGTPMKFYLENDADGPKAYFIKMNKYQTRIKQNYNFMINAGNYGSVLSFEPSYRGTNIMADAKETFGFVDVKSNEVTVYNAQAKVAESTQPNIGIYGSTSADKMKSLISNRWYDRNVGAYQATLTIVGNPNMKPVEYINVMPFRPDGTIHHTGGTYQIIGVTDTIQGGVYITTLQLTKANLPETGETLPFEEVVKFGGVG